MFNKEYQREENDFFLENFTPFNNVNDINNQYSEDKDTGDKTNMFIITRKNNKKGRKRKMEYEKEIFDNNYHNKYISDNVIRKIQVHFISFIITFINLVLLELGYRDIFLNINYSFKADLNKRNIIKIKNSNIGYILCQKISSKYKKKPETNIIIYEKLKNIPILRNIFDYNYTDFFKDFYYNNENNLNLNKFGLNIDLKYKYGKKIKMYNDLKEANIKDPKYIKRLDEYVYNLIK